MPRRAASDERTPESRLQRPEVVTPFSFDTALQFGGPAIVRGLEQVVPIESVQPGDTQVFAARAPEVAGPTIDLDVLSGFPSVYSVATSTDVQASTPLPSIRELLVVGMTHSPLPDARTLANLPSLESLWALWAPSGRGRALDLAPEHATTLRRLAIPRHLLPGDRPIESLRAYTGLRELRLKHCKPNDSVAPLGELLELRNLSAEGGAGWGRLDKCTKLEEVSAFGPRIKDLRGFASWRELRRLLISMGSLSSVEGAEGFQQLEVLGLRALKLTSLAPLSGLPALRDVYLQYLGHLTDIAPLGTLPSLRKLVVEGSTGARSGMNIASLKPLEHALNLEELILEYASVEDGSLGPLEGLPKLRRVELPINLADQATAFRLARPDVQLLVAQPEHRPPFVALGVVDITYPVLPDRRWAIFQDLTELLGQETNTDAEKLIWGALARRSDGLLDRIAFDSESDAVGIMATEESDIRAVAMIINELATSGET